MVLDPRDGVGGLVGQPMSLGRRCCFGFVWAGCQDGECGGARQCQSPPGKAGVQCLLGRACGPLLAGGGSVRSPRTSSLLLLMPLGVQVTRVT